MSTAANGAWLRSRRPPLPYWLLLFAFALVGPSHATPGDGSGEPGRFKILTEHDGLYRVGWEDLADAGLTSRTTERLTVVHRGEAVPIWRRDADGRFGPGDEIVFRAEHLAGEETYFNDFSRYNVYFLVLGTAGESMRDIAPPEEEALDAPPIIGREHFETDELLMRFGYAPGNDGGDVWFWTRLTQIDRKPFRLPLDLGDFDARGPIRARVALRGWSHPLAKREDSLPDHVVEVLFDGQPVGQGDWASQEEHVIEIEIDPAAVRPGTNYLEVRVPPRVPEGETDPLIDVVLLNWIEIEYPRGGSVAGDRQDNVLVPPGETPSVLKLTTAADRRLLVFGSRSVFRTAPGGAATDHRILLPAGFSGPLTVVPDEAYLEPAAILPTRPSDLRSGERQADYLIIAHPSLLEAVRPLAELHRRHGLTVALINVFDVYDEFNHGIVDPGAIRDFIAFTRSNWQRPAPRFVLLVGDASWDVKNDHPDPRNYADWTYLPGEVRKGRSNKMTEYVEGAPRDRNLLPTWRYQGAQGHAASDNYYVAVEGDDFLPDLAIGRFSVVTPEEVEAIVDKTIRYVDSPPEGEWRHEALWITNESVSFQKTSDRIGETLEAVGFQIERVYPRAEEADNTAHQERLLEAFDRGELLVHFLGHGGRYIWRTGPPDFRKNHDLFTLDHLDRLEPSERLPVILSMTCYSAPFDHPLADSIGEKFLRLPGRGAIGVIAASWRVTPSPQLSIDILQDLLRGNTIGEALMEAKRSVGRRDLVETFNLLGDPAVRLPLPADLRSSVEPPGDS